MLYLMSTRLSRAKRTLGHLYLTSNLFLFVLENLGDAPLEKQTKNDAEVGSDQEDEPLKSPSKQEIEESFKPENTIAVQTVRDKKRKVTKKIQEKKQESNEGREVEAVKLYLTNWKNREGGSVWKFEKKKQIFIQNHWFDSKKIEDEDWSVCLEYLEGSKGKSRDTLMSTAEKLIEELDACESKEEAMKVKYNRCRDLLQTLN